MESAFEELLREFEELRRGLRDLQQRVGQLEEDRSGSRPAGLRRVDRGSERGSPGPALAPPVTPLSAGTVTLVGRTLVVLGGAYLIRAFADRELVPPLAGAVGALLYAAAWWVQAARSAARGERRSALFHGFTGLAIAHPLLWETTLVFELIGAPAAAGVLVALLALGLGVAWRSRLPPLAWGAVIAHVTTCLLLGVATRSFLPLALALLASAAALEWAALRDRWLPLRWPVALTSDLAVCMLVSATLHRLAEAASPAAPAAPTAAVLGALLVLPAVYLTGAGLRSLGQRKPVSTFEMVQAPVSLGVALGGAVYLRLATGESLVALGALACIGAAGAYAAAFVLPATRAGPERSFHAWASLGIGLALTGAPLLLPGRPVLLTGAWSLLALASVGAGTRFDRATPKIHGSLYALAAAGASGLLTAAAEGLAGDLRSPASLSAAAGLAWGVAAVCWTLLRTGTSTDTRWHALLGGTVLAALVVGSGVGLAARSLAPPVLDAAASRGPAAIAAMRSLLIAAAAIGLAFAGWRWRLRELRWLVPVALAGGAAKMLLEDLRVGDPVALCVALAAYGGALIAIPRWLREEPAAVAVDPVVEPADPANPAPP